MSDNNVVRVVTALTYSHVFASLCVASPKVSIEFLHAFVIAAL